MCNTFSGRNLASNILPRETLKVTCSYLLGGIMSTLIALNNSSSSLYKNSSSYVIIAYFIHLFIYLFIYLFKDFCLI